MIKQQKRRLEKIAEAMDDEFSADEPEAEMESEADADADSFEDSDSDDDF